MKKIALANLKEAVKAIRIFSNFSTEEMDKLVGVCEVFSYETDEVIISQDELSVHFFCIIEGYVEVSLEADQEKDLPVTEIHQGDIFGEAAIFLDFNRTANVIAKSATTIIRIHREKFIGYINSVPQTAVKVLVAIIFSLLNKLRNTNTVLALEKDMSSSSNYLEDLNKFLPKLTLKDMIDG